MTSFVEAIFIFFNFKPNGITIFEAVGMKKKKEKLD
jgi:hypothetical protein